MSRARVGIVAALVALGLFAVVEACSDEPTTGQTGNLADPAVFEAVMRQTVTAGTIGVLDGINRLTAALAGGTPDGVTLTPGGGGVVAAVGVDLNGDGSRESTITGTLTGDISSGAQIVISSISAPQQPTLSAGGSAEILQQGPGLFLIDNASGSGGADPPGSGNAANVSVTGAILTLDLTTGNPDGLIDMLVTGEGSTLSVSALFEPNGQGGFQVRFIGDDFEFTVP